MTRRLPAEWETQDGVLLAWPHAESDWLPLLAAVEPVYTEIVRQVSRFERVLLVAPDRRRVSEMLRQAGAAMERVAIFEIPTNDTWARDFGPLTVYEGERPVLLDFGFNGWGLKFAACLDNQVTSQLAEAGAFRELAIETPGLILEGGSIESDGRGTLLTTSQCLLNRNRNPHLDRRQLEEKLASLLGADHFLWLEHGYLAGDDTDSHIDTLARLTPDDTILYVACDDPADEHYGPLACMRVELELLRSREGKPFRLIPLPWPAPRFDTEGGRLPATYANYLVLNQAVLVPTYDDPHDPAALAAVGQAFPEHAIIGIDCLPLIEQHGSLHCVTMQLPKGVLP
ncbi:MAG: agmatine deiminase family protein [Desulfuromonadales bacterium]|nr:agmatine deiminase family protein [Desulfuromonadales bacterium]